jgi:hypothetical protein
LGDKGGNDVVEEEVQQSKMKGKSEMQQLQQDDVVLPKVNLCLLTL